jgi:1-acyl-sn-glycerol-3-phosphate acyltransferase
MRILRATVRLVALVCMTAIFCAGFLAVKPFITSGSKALAWRNWNFRTWARTIIRLLNIRIATNNAGPSAPFLLVSNHLSYIDIVVLASQLDCAFIAKSEVAAWPFVGMLGRWMDTIFIDRNRKKDVIDTTHQMHSLIDAGLGVVLFAEGTSTSGQQVSPFKSATLELAARQHVPVHYASISYATRVEETSAHQSVCWWGDMTFPDHFFRLLQLSGFEATVTFGPEPIAHADRHVLASKLWHAVSAQFVPVAMHR